MKVAVIGTGYVGLVTGACLAKLGHRVTCMDKNKERIESLRQGIIPIYEKGLENIVKENLAGGTLSFSDSLKEAQEDKEVLFVAVGTPSGANGRADLSQVEAVIEDLAVQPGKNPLTVVMKSTVPVGTGRKVSALLKKFSPSPERYGVVSCPEFLREGTAVEDFLHPERIVIGSENQSDALKMKELFRDLKASYVVTDLESAEMIKYASNAFLATKISFINEIANICERVGADVEDVAKGMGLDSRIGPQFLKAGLGYGGSCFPKDTQALIGIAEDQDYNFRILRSVTEVNSVQRWRIVGKLEEMLEGVLQGKAVCILGLSFKPGTDDVRDAPSLDIIGEILKRGGLVRAYDPLVKGEELFPGDAVKDFSDAYGAAKGVDAVVLVTEWPEFGELSLADLKGAMAGDILLDGRNYFNPAAAKELGFRYSGMGRT